MDRSMVASSALAIPSVGYHVFKIYDPGVFKDKLFFFQKLAPVHNVLTCWRRLNVGVFYDSWGVDLGHW
jgi:hypothetical protein